MNVEKLEFHAKNVRRNIIKMIYNSQSGHPGGSLSIVEILTYLYFAKMNINPEKPLFEDRDRLVLSKGHCAPALYAVLAERGFFPEDDLMGFRKIDGYLEGHPDMKKVPGIDMSSGSLGQGMSVANGIALAGKLDKKDYKVYCILGDGEIEEGEVWEAFMTASHYRLDNICAIIDRNGLQIDGKTKDVMSTEPLEDKMRAFGFHVITIDGNNFDRIKNAFDEEDMVKDKPTAIIANTIKGKGVSFMENEVGWHGKAPSKEEYDKAMEELK